MHRTQITISFDVLHHLFDLPDDVHIASVNQQGENLAIKVLSEREPPMGHVFDKGFDPKCIGYTYKHPEEFQKDISKGPTRGNYP